MKRPKAITPTERLLRFRARAEQQLVEVARLNWHKAVASRPLAAVEEALRSLLGSANARVRTWRDTEVGSLDYIELWEAQLALPIEGLAAEMVGDSNGWGRALRQCSPFAGKPF